MTQPDPIAELKAEIAILREDVTKTKTDIAGILELVAKFWEQFQTLKDSPMLSAFFTPPRKK